MIRTVLGIFALSAAAICANPVASFAETSGKAVISDLSGKEMGSVVLDQTPAGNVLVSVSMTGVTPGWHALHIHETGSCDAASGFKSAGGHLAGTANHGLVEGGPHPGDLPNQFVGEDGILNAEIFAVGSLSLAGDTDGVIFDADGSAFIMHAGKDDYTSQPSGAAGDMVACGVIEKSE